jgi:DNA-binding transcriptional MocR family regulator
MGELRRQIAYRSREFGCQFAPDELMVTSGATEGLATALQVVARSGDAVAVESPCYFQILRLIESLGMLAVEVRTDPDTGLDLNALQRNLGKLDIKAVIAVPNFHNPLGALMPDANKRALVELLAERQIPLIEDDVYGDLHFTGQRPWVAKAFDRTGNVILCSSFSKTLAPGWMDGAWTLRETGRHAQERAERHHRLADPARGVRVPVHRCLRSQHAPDAPHLRGTGGAGAPRHRPVLS